MYKQVKTIDGTISKSTIFKIDDSAFIPFDPANMDFVKYNKWLSEGNIPLPPDEPTLP